MLMRSTPWSKLKDLEHSYNVLLVNPTYNGAISSPNLRITLRIAPSLQPYIEVNQSFSYVMIDLPRELDYRISDWGCSTAFFIDAINAQTFAPSLTHFLLVRPKPSCLLWSKQNIFTTQRSLVSWLAVTRHYKDRRNAMMLLFGFKPCPPSHPYINRLGGESFLG